MPFGVNWSVTQQSFAGKAEELKIALALNLIEREISALNPKALSFYGPSSYMSKCPITQTLSLQNFVSLHEFCNQTGLTHLYAHFLSQNCPVGESDERVSGGVQKSLVSSCTGRTIGRGPAKPSAAIRTENLSVNPRRVCRSEQRHCIGDIVRLTETAERRSGRRSIAR
jgi:hypothetical protein